MAAPTVVSDELAELSRPDELAELSRPDELAELSTTEEPDELEELDELGRPEELDELARPEELDELSSNCCAFILVARPLAIRSGRIDLKVGPSGPTQAKKWPRVRNKQLPQIVFVLQLARALRGFEIRLVGRENVLNLGCM